MSRTPLPGLRRASRSVRRHTGRALVGAVAPRTSLLTPDRAVALTFDDGPDPQHTPAVLDELARLGAVATFFLVGRRAEAHPGLVRRILDEGHAVGSHSSTHPEPWRLPVRGLAADYRRGRAQVEDAAQRSVALFRPPKGYVDSRGALAMLAAGVRPWLWSIDPGDWRPDATVADISEGVAELGTGDVVLLHDAVEGPLAPSALDRSATCGALAAIVALAAGRDLRFVTLSRPRGGGDAALRTPPPASPSG